MPSSDHAHAIMLWSWYVFTHDTYETIYFHDLLTHVWSWSYISYISYTSHTQTVMVEPTISGRYTISVVTQIRDPEEIMHFSSIEKAILHRLRVSAWPGDVYLKYYRPSCTFLGYIPGFGGAGALKSAIWKKSHFYEKECVIMFMSLKVSYGSQSLTLSFWSWSQQPWSAHISWSNEICNA